MCGLIGIVGSHKEYEISPRLLEDMCDSIAHRGPDDSGIFLEDGAGLGHRRLSIVDLSHGHQPMVDRSRQTAVVYNGEIYNFKEIRAELAGIGHQFDTNCDTEVVLQAWNAWGKDCVTKFRGMFAFAVWDGQKQQLFLARDRLGIKPLYYSVLSDGAIAFGSELKALLKIPGLSRVLDQRSIEDYFSFGYIPDPKSILQNVAKLQAGHTLLFDRRSNQSKLEQYWDVDFSGRSNADESDCIDQLREQLDEAVGIRLMADVPLGAFLSGGVDSSAVVSSMARSSASRVKTYSVGFDEGMFDESRFAEAVVARVGTDHTKKTVDLGDACLIDELAAVYDEPFADNSAIPTYRLCQVASQHVKVALSGDGGDEVFAGYTWHFSHQRKEAIRQMIRWPALRKMIGRIGDVYPELYSAPRSFRLKSFLRSIGMNSRQSFFQSTTISHPELRNRLFSDGFRSDLQGYTAFDTFLDVASKAPDDPVAFAQYIDLKLYLCGDILVKVDRASMAHGLEVRVPILDHNLIEWAAELPPSMKIRRGDGKHILKRAMETRVPTEVLHRAKQGFDVPLSSWFRDSLLKRLPQLLESEMMLDLGVFNPDAIMGAAKAQEEGTADHSEFLWALIMFEASLRRILV